jgi:hypothetical protein
MDATNDRRRGALIGLAMFLGTFIGRADSGQGPFR